MSEITPALPRRAVPRCPSWPLSLKALLSVLTSLTTSGPSWTTDHLPRLLLIF